MANNRNLVFEIFWSIFPSNLSSNLIQQNKTHVHHVEGIDTLFLKFNIYGLISHNLRNYK